MSGARTKEPRFKANTTNLELRLAVQYLTSLVFSHTPFTAEPKKRQCKVLFEYHPVNEDELELKTGDIIDITEEVKS